MSMTIAVPVVLGLAGDGSSTSFTADIRDIPIFFRNTNALGTTVPFAANPPNWKNVKGVVNNSSSSFTASLSGTVLTISVSGTLGSPTSLDDFAAVELTFLF